MLTSKTITATKLDGSTVEIKVNALPLSRLEEFIHCQGDFAAVITLTSGLTTDQQNQLIGASSLALLEAADELNDPLARRWMERQTSLIERINKEIKKLSPAGPLPTSPPPSSPTAVPPTGTPPRP